MFYVIAQHRPNTFATGSDYSAFRYSDCDELRARDHAAELRAYGGDFPHEPGSVRFVALLGVAYVEDDATIAARYPGIHIQDGE